MNLSKQENEVYRKIKESDLIVFSVSDLCLLMDFRKTKTYNLIKALKKKQVIKKLGKGKFALSETNELEIASALNFPSYISFWTALNYYGFSDNTPKKIFIATTKYYRDIENFKYVTLSKERFFGYTSVGKITISEKEKAIIDSLLFPRYSGGIKEIKYSLENAVKEIDLDKLVRYANKIKSKAVKRRLGYLLESLDIDKKISKKHIEKLQKNKGRGYELLDPTLEKKNKLNKKWLLDINI